MKVEMEPPEFESSGQSGTTTVWAIWICVNAPRARLETTESLFDRSELPAGHAKQQVASASTNNSCLVSTPDRETAVIDVREVCFPRITDGKEMSTYCKNTRRISKKFRH